MMFGRIINFDADPFIPDGWKVEEHIKGGEFEWDPAKVALYLSKSQQDGKSIRGDKLCKELKGRSVYNANLLDFLLVHPELIPEEWKDKIILFCGTTYRFSKNRALAVRHLGWNGDGWDHLFSWLYFELNYNCPVAVPA